MNLLIPVGIVLAGLLASGVIKTGSELANGLKFQIDPLRSLKNFNISKSQMEIPVAVNLINPTPTGMPLDSIFASIYKKVDGEWTFIGSSEPNLTNILIKPNATTALNFTVKVPLIAAGTEIFNLLKNVLSPGDPATKPKETYKVEVRVGIEGHVMTENFEQTV